MVKFNLDRTIEKRFKDVYKRNIFNHLKVDIVVSDKINSYTLKNKSIN